jgi:hypothetical protein
VKLLDCLLWIVKLLDCEVVGLFVVDCEVDGLNALVIGPLRGIWSTERGDFFEILFILIVSCMSVRTFYVCLVFVVASSLQFLFYFYWFFFLF